MRVNVVYDLCNLAWEVLAKDRLDLCSRFHGYLGLIHLARPPRCQKITTPKCLSPLFRRVRPTNQHQQLSHRSVVVRRNRALTSARPPCPIWVIRDRVEPVASLAMSAMPPKAEVNSEH